ncbi:MAG: 50S ribosomal protein L21 [Acidobacteria bacterium]|nr:50S ribosomal protein L21 [Acidobacteriota bacterium]
MFAIIQSGGHQVKVQPGRIVAVDRIDVPAGEQVTLDQVLLVAREGGEVVAGAPFVAGAKVVGEVLGEARGPKLRVFKKKRRKGSRKTRGHRSTFTQIKVSDIVV